jgi:hypothetical protein
LLNIKKKSLNNAVLIAKVIYIAANNYRMIMNKEVERMQTTTKINYHSDTSPALVWRDCKKTIKYLNLYPNRVHI